MGLFTWTTRPWSTKTPPAMGDVTQLWTVPENEITNNLAFQSGIYPVFNVRDPAYGATGNGTTDDTTAFGLARDAAIAANGGTLLVPDGTYILDGFTINFPRIWVVGTGRRDRCVLKLKSSSTNGFVIRFGDGVSTSSVATECGLSTIKINGNVATNPSGDGLRLWSTTTFSMHNVFVRDCGQYGILEDTPTAGGSSGSNGMIWYNVKVATCAVAGIECRGSKENVYAFVSTDLNTGDGWRLLSKAFTGPVEATQNQVIGYKANDNSGYGLVLDGIVRSSVTGMLFVGNLLGGIFLKNSLVGSSCSVVISNGIFRANASTEAQSHIGCDPAALAKIFLRLTNVQIQGGATTVCTGIDLAGVEQTSLSNILATGVLGPALRIRDSAAGVSARVSLSNFHADSCGVATHTIQDGIRIEGGSADIFFSNVRCANSRTSVAAGGYEINVADAGVLRVFIDGYSLDAIDSGQEINVHASALKQVVGGGGFLRNSALTVLDVASVAGAITLPVLGDFFTLSGANTVTSITASWAGRQVTLLTTSTAGLADGSNLKLNLAFIGSADATITLRCNGTNWYEVARSVN